ncbi:LLM class flavin-dependent oxidoreductase [Nonomuraea thailandensis]
MPYRHPLLMARMAANLNRFSGGRLVLGVGTGWARQEFDALGVPFERRGRLTDEHLAAMRAAWADEDDYRAGPIPIWVGGNGEAGLRRAVRLGEAYHPLRTTLPWLRDAAQRLKGVAGELGRPARADPAHRAAADRHAGHRPGAARGGGHDRPDRRRPGGAARARGRHRGARPVRRRPRRDAAPGDGLARAGRRGRPLEPRPARPTGLNPHDRPA